MAMLMRSRPDAAIRNPATVAATPRPAVAAVDGEAGPMLAFAATMDLLAAAGVPVAPYRLVRDPADAAAVPFAGPYVAKLADVAHRTLHGAVRLGVTADALADAMAGLRDLARRDGLPEVVAVQKMIDGAGEAFIGIRGRAELGPVVAFSLGGVFVGVLRRVSGRLAPFTGADAGELIAEFDDLGVLSGARGRPPWNREALAAILVQAGQLASADREWIETFDINPLVFDGTGFVAVDGLYLLR